MSEKVLHDQQIGICYIICHKRRSTVDNRRTIKANNFRPLKTEWLRRIKSARHLRKLKGFAKTAGPFSVAPTLYATGGQSPVTPGCPSYKQKKALNAGPFFFLYQGKKLADKFYGDVAECRPGYGQPGPGGKDSGDSQDLTDVFAIIKIG
ncbi:MAG: hypothetical protein AB7U63_18640, partial [Porticoccaceae bacterium]